MEKQENEIFYGKIILFGEYGVIFDSMALTIPFAHFQGTLNFPDPYKYTNLDYAQTSNGQLKEYATYIKNLVQKEQLKFKLNINSFEDDIEKGLYFESSIPQSYGLGSSGALVASVYCRYAIDKIKSSRTLNGSNILELKEIFAQLESFFHGKSSGIDPLNAFIKFPLLIKNKSEITTVAIPRKRDKGNGGIFLVNTGGPGKTEPLVHLFIEKCKQEKYFRIIQNEFIPVNNNCIKNLLSGQLDEFFNYLEQLSDLQMRFMNPMIPYHFQEHWKHGLKTKDYFLKLCGSGGGGYLLGFTRDFDNARKYFKEKDIELVTVYKSSR
ncbi:MAG: hypothetical protein B6D61_00225 [Bacteroidetes bacterium 4484_249]|nr:MAG: hypothetical protein B6D61_00225 [Bacteroidetes bacterium 4484_249]